MTLCAAAIFGFPYLDEQGADEPLEPGVMTISDCMLTSFGSGDDIEFETDQTKIYPLIAGKAIALVSNSIDLHRMLVDETIKQIEASKIEDVSQAAEIYCENFKSLRRKRAESIWLAPYNLNADSFISRQRQFDQGIARDLAHRLLEEKLEVESIIAGVDSNGTPRIYSIEDPGILTSRDGVAFHAIGSGARQFESLFMAEGYTRTRTWAETMFLMYSAKKKAESSPGVGRETDMFLVDKNGFDLISEKELDALEQFHKQFEIATEKTKAKIIGRMMSDERFIGEEEPQGQKEKQERSSSEQK